MVEGVEIELEIITPQFEVSGRVCDAVYIIKSIFLTMMALQSSTILRCMSMKIMATGQLQPHLDMERKGRRTIKVCFLQSVADAAFLPLDRRGEEKKGFKILQFSLPPV